MRLHLCTVSGQILPNLIPALMERPDRVILLASASMQEAAFHLRRILKEYEVEAEIEGNAPDSGLERIYEFAMQVAEKIQAQYPGAEITVNVTGGTKLMSFGLIEYFRSDAQRLIYTDTAHQVIESLPDPRGHHPATQPMTDVLDVKQYLDAQQFRVTRIRSDQKAWQDSVNTRKSLCKKLGEQAAVLGDFIGILNKAGGQALDNRGENLLQPEQTLPMVPHGPWADMLMEMDTRNLLAWKRGTPSVTFLDAENTRFLSGRWLEEYVWHILKDNGAFDVRLGVEGNWLRGKGSKNELDVLATKTNRLLYVECKTLTHREEKDSDLAYKADSLGNDLRGIFGETWLVTARPPTDNLLDRARQSHFKVIGPQELPALKEHVLAWVRGE
ncbi:MAG: Card1-like endonuclease domain-containing protein [Acidithiobacillus sp.]